MFEIRHDVLASAGILRLITLLMPCAAIPGFAIAQARAAVSISLSLGVVRQMRISAKDRQAEVTITHRPEEVCLKVANRDLAAGPPVPGLGIEGMRCRISAVGGQLTAGPGRDPGIFTVRATIPRRSSEMP